MRLGEPLTMEDLRDMVAKVVAERGEEYTYFRVTDDDYAPACVYFEKYDGKWHPSCLYGMGLAMNGIDHPALTDILEGRVAEEELDEEEQEWTRDRVKSQSFNISDIIPILFPGTEHSVVQSAQALQSEQDRGVVYYEILSMIDGV